MVIINTRLKVWKLKYITVTCYNHLHIVRGDCSMRAKFQNGCLAFRRCLWGSDRVIIHSPISIYSTFYKFCIFAFQPKKKTLVKMLIISLVTHDCSIIILNTKLTSGKAKPFAPRVSDKLLSVRDATSLQSQNQPVWPANLLPQILTQG